MRINQIKLNANRIKSNQINPTAPQSTKWITTMCNKWWCELDVYIFWSIDIRALYTLYVRAQWVPFTQSINRLNGRWNFEYAHTHSLTWHWIETETIPEIEGNIFFLSICLLFSVLLAINAIQIGACNMKTEAKPSQAKKNDIHLLIKLYKSWN